MAQSSSGAVGDTVTGVVSTDTKARTLTLALLFVVAAAVSAQLRVYLPYTTIPMTLQPLVVILAGAVLGRWAGAGAMAAYLAVGMAGAPVFSSGGAGFGWLMGPTGGYLLAFPLAAFLTGAVAGPISGGVLRKVAGLTLGIATIYLGGVTQLTILTQQPIGETLAVGVAPFLVADLIKVGIAVTALEAWKRGRFGEEG